MPTAFPHNSIILNNLQTLRVRIANACQSVQRDPLSVQLLLATKTVDAATIQTVIDRGFGLIGENKIQELVYKVPLLTGIPTNVTPIFFRETHFIGTLQSNKIKEAIMFSDCIQSVDRLSLAYKLNMHCQAIGKIQNILIQVNTSNEISKMGIAPDMLFDLLNELQKMRYLNIQGFMTLGLNSKDELLVRQGFSLLRKLNENARYLNLIPESATTLSMGMSNDLEWAIAEGATLIRVGSAVFGSRTK